MISIIIPAWNGAAVIGACLESLAPQLQADDEIIVVDNGSLDGTPDQVARQCPAARVLRLEGNRGFAGGVNQGLLAASGDTLLLLNQDVVLRPGCLRTLHVRLQAEGPAIIGCKLLYPDGQTIQHAGGVIRMPRGEPDHYGYRQADHGQWDTSARVEYVTGAIFVFDRMVFTAVGLFDEGFYPAYYEEADYCYRAHAIGFPVIYEPAASAVHHEAQVYGQRSSVYLQAMARGRLRFLLKHQTTAQFCNEFVPAEMRWLSEVTSAFHRRILVHAYLHAMLAVPHLQAQGLLGAATTTSIEGLLTALEQLSHYALNPARSSVVPQL